MSPSQSKSTNSCMDKLRYIMLLAPFQLVTRIELETNVNTSSECYLDIKNTGDKTLNVTITKVPAAERQITLSLSELEVQGKSNGTIRMVIKWSPKETGCWRDVLQLTDNRRMKYHIVIATTAKGNKKSCDETKRSIHKEEFSGKKLQLLLNLPAAKRSTKNIAAKELSLSPLSETKWHTSSFIRESGFGMQNTKDELYELDPFAGSTTQDPFLTNTVYRNEQWLLQQELAFTKWLNALLSSPEDLSVDIETDIVTNIGKVWQLCEKRKNTVLAETKEAVSARYHTGVQLDILRKAASAMFKSNKITQVLSQIHICIIYGNLRVKSDLNLHLNIGLQKIILALFLNYNPLWLRIGLETVYSESIPLQSNNDITGLTRFLLTRFFSDPQLTKMPGYHKVYPSRKIVTKLNEFILKKFLYLIYFLDYAKQHKLIGHDPCLFHKRAQHKESREILLSFSRELLSGIGDVTKVLRKRGYVLTHRQTYIEEYNYAVTDIRCDLRDGVRLCRVMEFIIGVREFTTQQHCRVPAISYTQKEHNVLLALNALQQAGYHLQGDIDAKSIVHGHWEKTMSLLWQIIYKYQEPRDRAARVLQRWWRGKRWYLSVKNFLRARRNLAAIIIQRLWRRKITPSIHWKYDSEERKFFLRVRAATVFLQGWWRNVRETRKEKLREPMVIKLQRKWRTVLLLRTQRDQERSLMNAASMIQRRWRAKQIKNEFGEALQLHEVIKLANSNSQYWKMINVNLRNCVNNLHNVQALSICLNSLDIITKFSYTVCVILCQLNLADKIYKTIAQNNRSQPWRQVCLRACSILITLTKHDYTRKYVLNNDYALVLMKLLNGSLKDKEVFVHCATLIWLLSQNEDYSKAMMACPQINWFIENIQQKILKDDDIVTKLQKLKDVEKLYPSCKPDHRNTQKPRLFPDMGIAITAIVKKNVNVNS